MSPFRARRGGHLLLYGPGFACGAMVWVVFSEPVPDALEEGSSELVAAVATASVVAMLACRNLIRRGDPGARITG